MILKTAQPKKNTRAGVAGATSRIGLVFKEDHPRPMVFWGAFRSQNHSAPPGKPEEREGGHTLCR